MKHLPFALSHKFALIIALHVSVLALPAHGTEQRGTGQQRQPTDPCAKAASNASSVSADGQGVHSSTVIAGPSVDGNRNGNTDDECRNAPCGPSSSVATGAGGLSGSTTMPDGSSVTVRAGNGRSTSSASNASSSGSRTSSASSSSGSSRSSAAAGAGQGVDCEVRVHPDSKKDRRSKSSKP